MRRDGLAGIFLTDLSLVVLQPYTDDTQLARKAIENAGASNPSTYASNNQRARAVRGRLVEMMQSKDESGRVVEKLSNQYRLGGPVEKMEEARRGRIQ
ncbi:MAG TPA: hypothetical protein VM936_02530 [Pyrinomonadaceae bacterium]|nr:hypothetical protein [Pyrinomonadaceae bacterium]